MMQKPEVAIVGTGRLGTALALALAEQGYSIGALVGRTAKARDALVLSLTRRRARWF